MSDPTRLLPSSATPPPVTGPDYMDAVAREVAGLWNRSVCVLTGLGGTANAITATVTPALIGPVVEGMLFQLTPGANNSGAATLSIGGAAPLAITDEFGQALTGGDLAAGRRYLLLADGVGLRAMGVVAAVGGRMFKRIYRQSGVWLKPDGLVKVIVMVRGGGGGGGHAWGNLAGGGGGGGGEAIAEIMAADLGQNVPVTVGNGGAPAPSSAPNTGGLGGSSSFGSHAVATGGAGGRGGGGEGGSPPGAAGIGTVGDVLLRGRPSAPNFALAADLQGQFLRVSSVVGGGAPTGGDAPPVPGSGNPALAGPPGTGAGGMGGFAGAGAAGGSGLVVVEEYYR